MKPDNPDAAVGHTPAPWIVNDEVRHPYKIRIASRRLGGGKLIAEVDDWVPRGTHEHEVNVANARVIAAAPDLLAALKDCADMLDHLDEYGDKGLPVAHLVKAARAAIAKAEGDRP